MIGPIKNHEGTRKLVSCLDTTVLPVRCWYWGMTETQHGTGIFQQYCTLSVEAFALLSPVDIVLNFC